jgi:hypothetical protein
MAGYSGTPLPQKLGIKPGAKVAFIGAPDGFADSLGALPVGTRVQAKLAGPLDVIVFFNASRAKLEAKIAALHGALTEDGGLWIAWPKKSSGVATDLTENALREIGLPRGLVDNKVCAIDETWSGLRFVIRRELRKRVTR